MSRQEFELALIGIITVALIWLSISTFRYYKRKKRYIKKLHRYAKGDDVISQRELGVHYQKGDWVKKDCTRAYFWYTKAVIGGDEEAKRKLAGMSRLQEKKRC